METPKRRLDDMETDKSSTYVRSDYSEISHELQDCLTSYTERYMREPCQGKDRVRSHRHIHVHKDICHESCVKQVNKFLDCEFSNPVAITLNRMFRKLKQVIISKDGRK